MRVLQLVDHLEQSVVGSSVQLSAYRIVDVFWHVSSDRLVLHVGSFNRSTKSTLHKSAADAEDNLT